MALVIERVSHQALTDGSNADSYHSHAGGGSSFDSYPGAFRDTGSTNLTQTVATIGLDAEILDPDGNYSLSGGEITVTNAGYYHISYNLPVNDDGSAGTSRGRVFAWVEEDSGGFAAIVQSRAQDYHRETSGGSGLSGSFDCQLTANVTIRLRGQVSSTVDVSTESGEAALSIHRIRE